MENKTLDEVIDRLFDDYLDLEEALNFEFSDNIAVHNIVSAKQVKQRKLEFKQLIQAELDKAVKEGWVEGYHKGWRARKDNVDGKLSLSGDAQSKTPNSV